MNETHENEELDEDEPAREVVYVTEYGAAVQRLAAEGKLKPGLWRLG